MRIALVVVPHPSARGGAETHYDGLETSLRAEGHDVERVAVRCDESSFEGILDGYRAAERLDLGAFDAVVSTKAPSYAVRHRRHALHLIHTIRVFYDMFDAWSDGSEDSRRKRDRIREIDFQALSAIPDFRRFANGRETAARLERYLGLSASVLHPALLDSDLLHEGPFEFLLHVGRLHPWKRADLVVRAFRETPGDVPLVLAGTGPEEASLKRLAQGDDRIRFLGEVDRTTLIDLYSRALAVVFPPVREDFGYVTLEAMLSGKPVITCSDSGEPARLVEDGRTGAVVAPTVGALAAAMTRLCLHPDEARRLGSGGRSWACSIRWTTVARTLLAALEVGGAPLVRATRRVLVVDNQPIEPPVGGGRLRLHGIYSNLPSRLEAVYVGTYDWPGEEYRCVWHGDGALKEVTVPQSPEHFRAHEALRADAPSLTMDVTFPLLGSLSRGFVERVAHETASAELLVLSHPWVYPIVAGLPEARGKPIVYDAQNVEGRLRRSILGDEGLPGAVAGTVAAVEADLCRAASAILACSEEDALGFVEDYGVPREKVHVVPNGVDTRRVRPASAARKRAARERLGLPEDAVVAVFVGSNYPPNVEAAWLVVNRLAPALPAVRFVVVGGCLDPADPEPVPANVDRLGPVPDELRDAAYAAADVALNPMLRGSGTNIKMLDYFAAGLPVVATPVGARGLVGGEGRAFLVASPEELPASLESLARDPEGRRRMGAAARRLAEGQYDWKRIGSAAGRVLLRLAGEPVALEAPRPRPTRRTRLAVMSTWETRCGIADYTGMLVRSLPPEARTQVYAERRQSGPADPPRVRANWEIGFGDPTALEESLEADRPDVLLLQHNPGFVIGEGLHRLVDVARRRGIPLAATLHAAQWDRDPSLVEAFGRLDRIYVHRQSDVTWLTGKGVAAPIRVVPQGFPSPPLRPLAEQKRSLGLTGRFVVGHFGFARPHKGALELLEAFDLLAARCPEAFLLLLAAEYPSDDSAAYRKACEARVEASPYRDRIAASFEHLDLDDVTFVLQACDAVAFPYHASRESSSAAVRLAMACSRPVVVSRSEIFEELDGTVETFPSIEAESIASTFAALASDPERAAAARERQDRFVAERTWRRAAAVLWGDLRAVVSGAAVRRAGA